MGVTGGADGGRAFPLDALRGLAALAVLASHLRFLWPGLAPWGAHGLALLGQVAVEAFLVLSGFLLARSLLRPGALAGPALARFGARRALRVLPLLWLALPCYLLVQPPGPAAPPPWQVATLTAWMPGAAGTTSPFMGFAWTLAAEAWGWALLALVLGAAMRAGLRPVPALAGAWLAAVAAR